MYTSTKFLSKMYFILFYLSNTTRLMLNSAHVFNYKHYNSQACIINELHFIDVPALRWPKATHLGTFLRIVFGAIDWTAAGKGSARVLHIYIPNIWLNTLTSWIMITRNQNIKLLKITYFYSRNRDFNFSLWPSHANTSDECFSYGRK